MSEQPAKQLPHEYQRYLDSVPKDWDRKYIRQLGTVVGGGTPSRNAPSFWRGAIPWITPGEVSGNATKFLYDTNEHISASGLASSGANVLPAGSLLVTTRATLGARVINAVPMATNQGFKSIIFRQEADSGFYFHLFEKVQSELLRRASGTTFLEISGTEFANIELPSPSPDEKLRISEILDTVDTAIQQTESIIRKLQATKQGLLHDLLTRGISSNGELRQSQIEAPHLYKESPIGWLPNEWDVKPLSQILAEPTKSGLYKPSQFHGRGPLMVQMGGLFNGEVAGFQTATRVQVTPSEMKTFGLSVGDLLFARRSLVFEGAGLCVIVRDLPGPSTFESSIVRVRIRKDVAHPEYVCQFLRGEMSSAQRRTLIRQVAVSGVSSSDIRQLLVGIPSLDEQKQIVDRQMAAQDLINKEMLVVAKLRKQKAGLTDDLVSGRVRVTTLPAKAVQQQKGSS